MKRGTVSRLGGLISKTSAVILSRLAPISKIMVECMSPGLGVEYIATVEAENIAKFEVMYIIP